MWKSTLFNRLIQEESYCRFSIWGDRDRNYGKRVERKEFSVIDTGGYVRGSDDVF
jgi:GTP-binding protein